MYNAEIAFQTATKINDILETIESTASKGMFGCSFFNLSKQQQTLLEHLGYVVHTKTVNSEVVTQVEWDLSKNLRENL